MKGKPLWLDTAIEQRANALRDLLDIDPKDTRAWYAIAYGLFAHFPECCITFFVLIWVPMWDTLVKPGRPLEDVYEYDEAQMLIDAAIENYTELRPGRCTRIHCPACLLKARQAVYDKPKK